MVDRLLKAFEAIRNAPLTADEDTSSKRKERLAACSQMADTVCSPQMRNNSEFQKLLAVAIAGLLAGCNDPDSDVRIAADESLNRTITTLIDTHLGRLQVELYKTIKKDNIPIRTLRAALSKFSDLAHMVKPLKRRVFVTSLLPSLHRIMKMPGESIQETLAGCMDKLCSALGLFFTDSEIQELLSMFVENMASESVVIRRTATECAISICEGSCSPYHYLAKLVNSLFFLTENSQQTDNTDELLGALLGVRKAMISYQLERNAPFKQLLDLSSVQRLYNLLMNAMRHEVHNVVTASLEALQQLLKVLKRDLLTWFRQPEICIPCAEVLGQMLLSKSKVRVSVQALALSCMMTAALHEPATLRHYIADVGRHVCDVISVFFRHSDPMLRGNAYQLIGNVIKGSLEQQNYAFGTVSYRKDAQPSDCQDDTPVLLLETLCGMLASALLDKTSSATRQACQAVRTCITPLLMCTSPLYGVELLNHLLVLGTTDTYWLVKVEIVETLRDLNFMIIAHHEKNPDYRGDLLRACMASTPRHPFGQVASVQPRALQMTVSYLGDEDERVRQAATSTLLHMTHSLYNPPDWPTQQTLANVVDVFSRSLLNVQDDPSAILVARASFSKIIGQVVELLHCSQSRNVLVGCYRALNVLTDPEVHENARVFEQHENSFSLPNVLPITLDHLKVAWMSLELSTHINMLGLVGNIARAAPYEQFRPYVGLLLSHVLRVLNICVHITRKTPPVSSGKGRTSLDKKALTPGKGGSSASRPVSGSSPKGTIGDEEDPELGRQAPQGASRGYFAHLPHYMKLHDTMKSAYTAETITLEAERTGTSKFSEMVRAALEVLSVVVECEGAKFQAVAVEALSYMHGLIIPEPRVVLLNVQHLLAALFGTAAKGARDDSSEHKPPTFSPYTGFFERCVAVPDYAADPSLRAGTHTQQQASSDSSGSEGTSRSAADKQKPEQLSKATAAGLIRLFEPLVIRAMNMYTSTSSVPLQIQILDLLNILLALRVNYTLLDSDMLFVKSILKQLELIEHGHVRNVQDLLSHLFQFLAQLAREHNKLGDKLNMPRLLQLCDQLLASVHLAPRNALPALKPIVEEVFLSGRSKSKRPEKEAEYMALREVVTNTLIKQMRHPAVWELLKMLLQHFKIDNEEQWKRLSRTVVDVLLPLLSAGQITIKNCRVLRAMTELFNAVAPIALRPMIMLFSCAFAIASPHVVAAGPALRPVETAATSATNPEMAMQSARNEKEEALRELHQEANNSFGTGWISTLIVVLECIAASDELSILSGVSQFLAPSDGDGVSPASPPEEVFFRFLLDSLKYCGSHFHNRSPTDFECQEMHRLISLLQLVTNPTSFPRMHAAACRADPELTSAVGKTVLETQVVNPMVVVLWSQVVSDLQWNVGSWWSLCGLGETPGVLTVNQHICQLSVFLLECHKTALALRSGQSERIEALAAAQLEKPLYWYILLVQNTRESPVVGLATGMWGSSVAQAFLSRIAQVLDMAFVKRQTATQQRDLVSFFKALPASLMVTRMQMSLLMPYVRRAVRTLGDAVLADKIRLLRDVPHGQPGAVSVDTFRGLFAHYMLVMPEGTLGKRTLREFQLLGLQPNASMMDIESLLTVSPLQWLVEFVETQCKKSLRQGRSAQARRDLLLYIDRETLQGILKSPDFDLSLLAECFKKTQKQRPLDLALHAVLEDEHAAHTGTYVHGSSDPADESPLADASGKHLFDLLRRYSSFNAIVPSSRGDTYDPESSDAFLPPAPFRVCQMCAVAVRPEVMFCSQCGHKLSDEEATRGASPKSSSLSLSERAHLCHAITDYLRLDVNPTVVRSSGMEHHLLRFCLACLDVIADPAFEVEVWEFVTLVDCCIEVLTLPAVSELLAKHDESLTSKLVTKMIMLYRSFSAQPSSLLLVKEISDEPDQQSASGVSELFLGLTLEQTHALFWLGEQLGLELRDTQPSKISAGITEPVTQTRLPMFVVSRFRRMVQIILRFRLPLIHAYGMVVNPDTGAVPSYADSMLKELLGPSSGPIRQEALLDEPVLRAFCKRNRVLGYRTHEDMRELWSDIEPMLSSTAMLEDLEAASGGASQIRRLALRGATCVVTLSSARPRPGDPSCSPKFVPRQHELSFLLTKAGGKLLWVRDALEEDIIIADTIDPGRGAKGGGLTGNLSYNYNMERVGEERRYSYGQIAIGALCARRPVDTTSSNHNGGSAPPVSAEFIAQTIKLLTPTVNEPQKQSVPVLVGTTRMITVLLDSFMDPRQFKWALGAFTNIYRAVGVDDTMLLGYMVVGICKAFVVAYSAVGGTVGQAENEMVIKVLSEALAVPRISVQHAALHAWASLIEAKADSIVLPTLGPALQFVLSTTTPEIRAQPRLRTAALGCAFLAIERYSTECEAQGFTSRIISNAIEIVRIDRDGERVFQCIFKGFDRLLLCFVALVPGDRARIHELAKSWLASASTTQSVSGGYRVKSALKLLVTSMYTSQDGDRANALLVQEGATAETEMEGVSATTIEHIGHMFKYIRKGGFQEAKFVQRALSAIMVDFLPPREIMSLIMDNLSSFATIDARSPLKLAGLVHLLFKQLQDRGHQEAISMWLVNTCGSFLQETSRAGAVGILTCLFISVSQDAVIRGLLETAVSLSIDEGTPFDYCLFWMPALHFYLNGGLSDEAKNMFVSVFSAVPESPFAELADVCAQLGENEDGSAGDMTAPISRSLST